MPDETPTEQPIAAHRFVPYLRAMALGPAVVGVLGMVVTELLAPDGTQVARIVFASGFALLYGVLIWLFARRSDASLDDAQHGVRHDTDDRGAAARAGLVLGVLGGLVMAAVVAVAAVSSGDVPPPFAWGILPGSALMLALEARDVARWERRAGRVVHLRRGARRWAWTRAQARARLVTVPGRTD